MQDKGGREIVERMQAGKSSPAAKRPLDTYMLQWFSDHGRRYLDKQGASATHATSKSNHIVVAFRLRSLFIAEILRRFEQEPKCSLQVQEEQSQPGHATNKVSWIKWRHSIQA